MTTHTSPRQRTLDRIAEYYGEYMRSIHGPAWKLVEDDGFYVLIEKSTFNDVHYVSQHADPHAAAKQRDCMETTEDWSVVALLRVLRDGSMGTYEHEVKTTFTRIDGDNLSVDHIEELELIL